MRTLWTGQPDSDNPCRMTDVELVQYRDLHEQRMNTALDDREFPDVFAARAVHRMCVEELAARGYGT